PVLPENGPPGGTRRTGPGVPRSGPATFAARRAMLAGGIAVEAEALPSTERLQPCARPGAALNHRWRTEHEISQRDDPRPRRGTGAGWLRLRGGGWPQRAD